jgi:16S rRNA (cytosine1407-C5)-methyltransferase
LAIVNAPILIVNAPVSIVKRDACRAEHDALRSDMPESAPPFRSFRLVCRPEHGVLVEELLRAQGFVFEAQEFFPSSARRLLEEPFPLGASLAARFGHIYIQDRSSMLPPLALNPPSGCAALDLCASPGGKTGLLAQLTGETGFVLGNEPSRARLATLRRNLSHLDLIQTATCSFPGENMPLPDGGWTRILLDPPCSGWGTADRHPKVRSLWREEKTRPLIRMQRLLLREAARLLAPGGRLVYSTCTTNPRENEDQIRFAVEELGLGVIPLSPFAGFCFNEPEKGAEGSLLVNGRASGAQDFFIALLRKNAASPAASGPTPPPRRRRPAKTPLRRMPLAEILEDSLRERLPPGEALLEGERVHFLPQAGIALLSEDFRLQGVLLGRRSDGRLRPAPHLRRLLPPRPEEGSLNLEDTAPLEDLLAGRRLDSGLKGKDVALYWRGLPLARLRVREGRVFRSA